MIVCCPKSDGNSCFTILEGMLQQNSNIDGEEYRCKNATLFNSNVHRNFFREHTIECSMGLHIAMYFFTKFTKIEGQPILPTIIHRASRFTVLNDMVRRRRTHITDITGYSIHFSCSCVTEKTMSIVPLPAPLPALSASGITNSLVCSAGASQ